VPDPKNAPYLVGSGNFADPSLIKLPYFACSSLIQYR
jgi:hypothetical protein